MGFWRLPEQRLRIDVSVDVAIEARIDMNPMRLFPSEAGHDVGSIPVRRAVIIQDRLSTGHRTEQKSYVNGESEPAMTNRAWHCRPFPRWVTGVLEPTRRELPRRCLEPSFSVTRPLGQAMAARGAQSLSNMYASCHTELLPRLRGTDPSRP